MVTQRRRVQKLFGSISSSSVPGEDPSGNASGARGPVSSAHACQTVSFYPSLRVLPWDVVGVSSAVGGSRDTSPGKTCHSPPDRQCWQSLGSEFPKQEASEAEEIVLQAANGKLVLPAPSHRACLCAQSSLLEACVDQEREVLPQAWPHDPTALASAWSLPTWPPHWLPRGLWQQEGYG